MASLDINDTITTDVYLMSLNISVLSLKLKEQNLHINKDG